MSERRIKSLVTAILLLIYVGWLTFMAYFVIDPAFGDKYGPLAGSILGLVTGPFVGVAIARWWTS